MDDKIAVTEAEAESFDLANLPSDYIADGE